MDINSIDKTANLVHNNQMSLMVFQIQSDFARQSPTFFGMNVFKVTEVIEGKRFPIAMIPNTHSLIEGMIQLRGNFIPVIDLPTWLDVPMNALDKENSVIIVSDFSNHVVGFRVAHIHGVEEKEWNDLTAAKNINTAGTSSRVVNQTTVKHKDQDELCYILDVESLLIECMPDMAEKLKPLVSAGNWLDYYRDKTLLLADDSRAIRQYFVSILDQLGINYLIFDDGAQLIRYLDTISNEQDVSAVITDLEMPEASGHTVIKHVRIQKQFSKLPVAVHSSMTSENNERDAKKLGANFFIGKIDTDEFMQTLEAIALL